MKKSPFTEGIKRCWYAGGNLGEISNLKCPPCTYSISSSKCKYGSGGKNATYVVPLQTQYYYVSNSCQLGIIQFPSFQWRNFVIYEKQSKMWSGHAFLECNLLKQCMTSCIERHAINTRSAIDPTTGFWRNVGTKHYARLCWSACKARTLALPKIRTFRDWTFACVSIHHALLGLQEWGQPRWTTPKPGDSRAKGLFRDDHFHFHQSVKNQTVMVSTWMHPLLQTYHT